MSPEVEFADAAPVRQVLRGFSEPTVLRNNRRNETTANDDRPARELKRTTDTWPGRP